MKKRILSILLLCCMVLTLLPTAAFAAGELPDVKLSVPTTFDKTVDLTKQNGELKITDSKTYLIKGSADPNWYFQYRIKIDGKNNTPHIFLDGVRLQAPKDGPAIELYGGASACLYFIGGDSELIGAENFAALQKNKTDGYLRVLVQTGTKLTCQGGHHGAGIGGSKVGIKNFSQGHGVNLHFGSLATNIYGGEILAISGVYGAGIGGGQGGVGEWIYVYSGKLTVRSVSEGAGIGGGQGGPGRFIYIKGGTVNAGSESGGAGIGSGDQDGQNKPEDAHHIEISGGTVEAWSNYAGAGIGGGRDGSGYDISITGGVVRAQGYFGAGIGGGMNGNSGNILIKDTTLTALAGPLYPSSDYNYQPASAVGRGSNRVHYQVVMQDQEFAMSIEENIKIGASNGKSVWLSATGWQWRHNQEPKKYWYWDTTTELLIPNENGRVDLQRLSLPYAYNYGRVISELELRCEESTCSHEFVWANRDGCHIWACKNCGARDPAAEMSKQNGKHIPGDWSNREQLCTVCDHVLERDTKAPVMETLTDGESYTVEDTLDGKPGAYTFAVSDPAASGETSSGIKSVTINGEPQDGPTYSLPAPDGGNNDAGAEYTVVATDNAGNETTATVRTYRRHHVKVISGIENGKTYCEAQTVTINEKYIDTVTVNGTAVTLDEGGRFVLSPANGKQKIVVTDKAGNTAEMTVTVNDGHTLLADDNDCTTPVYCKFCNAEVIAAKSHRFTGNWQNDETAHWHICQNENCTITDRKTAHSGDDDGNCLTAVVCECGYVITAAKPAHTFNEWTSNGNGTHTRKCTGVGCNGIETENCSGGKATCTEQAVCTVCHTGYGDALGHNFTIAQHDETHHWNKCSRCDATDTKANHTGGTATCREKAVCEVCRSAYGKLSAANHVGGTEIRDAKPQSCIENGYTGDTYCKGCGEKLSSGTVIHADGHKGGTATCTDKAECEVCHEKYGEPDANHHTGIEMVDAVPATAASTGTVAHWRCTACGKLFADADGKREIRSEDTVTKKLAPSILDGVNSEWRKGDENGLTFSSDAAFSDFVDVLVDGKTVASENYERREGGIIVELKASYLATLAEGEHTLTIRSTSGDATARFTITASNSTNAWVWIIIGSIALGIGVTVAVFVVRKRKTA